MTWSDEIKDELFGKLRKIAKNYGGPGEAVEETLVSLWRNPEAAGVRSELRALGVGDRQIELEAFRDPGNGRDEPQ